MLGLESNEGRVLGLLYGLRRLAIVFNNVLFAQKNNNVLYKYKVLKKIYTWCFFRNFVRTAVPHAPTVDPPLVIRGWLDKKE